MSKKEEAELIPSHMYCGIDFLILVSPWKRSPMRPDEPESKTIHVRYNSPIGKFRIKTTITVLRMQSIDWKDYVCDVCLKVYAKEAPRRLATTTRSN